jgi:iron complex outermembrane receptor protein
VPQTQELAALNPAPVLFDRNNVLAYEKGTPKDKYSASVNWNLARIGATLRATRYGEVLAPDPNPALDFTIPATTLLDLEARFDVTDHVRVALGADNLTDEYPDELPPQNNTTGTQSFSNYSPFGRSGRFVYGRLNWTF